MSFNAIKAHLRLNAQSGSEDQQRGASKGQILILFAFFLTAMIGVLGLAIDLGFAYSQRRSVQNATDLAATAGAREVARFVGTGASEDVQNSSNAGSVVRTLVTDNNQGSSPTVLEDCSYIDIGGFPQSEGDPAGCDGEVPANATGVYVKASETHSTFFMRMIPGAPVYVTTRAEASAQVERLDLAGMDAPFILCGYNTKHWDSDDAERDTMNVLLSDYVINPAAIGEVFQLTGYTGTNTDIEKCGATGSFSTWHGLAAKDANEGKRIVLSGASTSTWWNPMIGLASVNASTITNKVSGREGCAELAAKPYNCVMMIPIATEYTGGTLKRFKVTKIMAFDVWQDESAPNVYWGRLIDDYLVFGASVPLGVDQAPWCRDCGSVVVVRLAS
jgi:hypothetical protein